MSDTRQPPMQEIEPAAAHRLHSEGVPVFDLRSERERTLGTVPGAVPMDPDDPERALLAHGLGPQDSALLCCASGVRSRRACARLAGQGYDRLLNIAGGFAAWREAGLPGTYPPGMDARSVDRYARHLVMPEVGVAGQARLSRARVLLVGAGGLGSPAALYLAAAGVGHLGIVDDDVVERSNLQRQVLHDDRDVGRPKIESAIARLTALNPDIEVTGHPDRLGDANARGILSGWDVVIDGSDNLPTRYLVNDACVGLGIPLVYGAVMGFDGQLSVFHPAGRPGVNPCYRCVFPAAPTGLADCNTAGVLGVLPGLVGILQATEALKLLLEVGEPLVGRLLLVDALSMSFRTVRAGADPACTACAKPA